jgi:hypothetical protein
MSETEDGVRELGRRIIAAVKDGRISDREGIQRMKISLC